MTKEQILTIVAARQSTRKFHLVFNAQYLPYKKKNLLRNRGDSHNRTEKRNIDRPAFHPRNWCSFFVVF